MYTENKDNVVVIYPFDDEAKPFSGRLLVSKDKDFAPEVFGRLQLSVVFSNGMTREEWKKLKDAGDLAFTLACVGVDHAASGYVHGCHGCGEEVYPQYVRDILVCPRCLSEDLENIDATTTA